MNARTTGLRETWKRALREHGARLVFLVSLLNQDTREQREDHWKRLTPGLKGINWRRPDWPNAFPVHAVHEQDRRTLPELINEIQKHLRVFMDSWFSAGQNYAKWHKEHPKLASALEESGRYRRVHFQAAPDGEVQIVTFIEPPVAERTLYGAASKFADFLQNPFRDVLAGRCKRCERYFFNRKGYEHMVYCSQKCRWDAHNMEKELSREQAHDEQQGTALSAMRKLLRTLEANAEKKVSLMSWKNVIVSEVNKKHGTQIEAKWVTRAINNSKGKYHRQLVRLRNAIEQLLQRGAVSD